MKDGKLKNTLNAIRWTIMNRKNLQSELNLITSRLSASAISFGQCYEDLIINRMTADITRGIYVDVGAHHPIRISNTFLLFLRGWKGINIDPLPSSKKWFDRIRPNDCNLNIGVASEGGGETLTYYSFQGAAYNTFDEKQAKRIIDSRASSLLERKEVPVYTLADILNRNLAQFGDTIDVLNVDTEGMELDVLRSNDWSKYKPRYIILESLSSGDNIINVYEDDAVKFLIDKGYFVTNKVFQSVFLKRED